MASMLDKLLGADISDATDFPEETAAPGLRSFDDAVRCNICRDFYDAPVSLSCGHGFCSACIRSALPEQSVCPTCRKPASEVHIRKDVALETAVQAWKVARPLILQLAREEDVRKAQPLPTKPPRQLSRLSERSGNKRRRLDSPSSPGSDDDEVIVIPSSPTGSGSSTPTTLPDLVPCPICAKDVPSQSINAHLDSNCKRFLAESSTSAPAAASVKTKQKQQWNKILGGPGGGTASKGRDRDKDKGKGKLRASPDDGESDHLSKVAYDVHPQKRIAEMLAEWELPTHGDKNALVRRHKRWVVLYNANVDRAPAHRRTLDQLRQDLRRAEDAEHKTRKETVEDPIAYQKANKTAFAKLTEAARPKKPPGSLVTTSTEVAPREEDSLPAVDDDTGEDAVSELTELESTASTYDVIDVDEGS